MGKVIILALCLLVATATSKSHSNSEHWKQKILGQTRRPEKTFSQAGKSPFPVDSRHGYVRINDDGSDIFYWLFRANNAPETAPLLIWFTGGPGCSSQLALLFENGPFNISETGEMGLNPSGWNDKAHLLFIDQPVGTGLSHSSFNDLSRSEISVANNMVAFFERFYDLYPEFKNKGLYLAGESFAGNYLPHISNALIKKALPYIDLKGVAIGNGWTNPGLQYPQYAEYAIDPENAPFTKFTQDKYNKLVPQLEVCKNLVLYNRWRMNGIASEFCGSLNDQILAKGVNLYDIRKPCNFPLCYDFRSIVSFMNSQPVMSELQSDKFWSPCGGSRAGSELSRHEFINSAFKKLPYVLESGVTVLIYNGDKDYICNWMGSDVWTRDLQWSGKEEFNKAKIVPEGTFGTSRTYKNFKFLRVFNAGHMVPHDQPQYALQMINEFMGFK